MALPVNYRPREGDVLVIHVTVKHDVDPGEDRIFVLLPGSKYTPVSVTLDGIAGIKIRSWKEGELVRHRNLPMVAGVVLATHEEKVWVRQVNDGSGKFKHGSLHTFHCNELEAVERSIIPQVNVRKASGGEPYVVPLAAHPLDNDPSWAAQHLETPEEGII